MKREVSKKEVLDRAATAVLKSGALSRDEIEQIASNGRLFSDIKRRIAIESNIVLSLNESAGFVFGLRWLALASLAAIAVITAVFAYGSILRRGTGARAGRYDAVPAPVNTHETEPVVLPDREPDRYTTAAYKTPKEKPAAVRTIAVQHPRSVEQEEQQPVDLYAFADMSSTEPVSGSRVVTVELPRASLVSLGVNVPLDGDKQLVKTDLLIGPDGVPRAIRVVDKFENF